MEVNNNLMVCYNTLKEQNYSPVFVSLYGSQNYNLDIENSDYDYKAVVMPTIEDVILNRKPVSTTIEHKSGLCDVKDIRLFFKELKKQNQCCVETLFSKDFYFSKDAVGYLLLKELLPIRELVAHYDLKATANCILGMILQKKNKVFKPRPSTKEKIEKYGYDSKDLCYVLRLEEFLFGVLRGDSYTLSLKSKNVEFLKKIKTYEKVYTVPQVSRMMKCSINNIKGYMREKMEWQSKNFSTEEKLDTILSKAIKLSFQEELKNEGINR